MYNDEHQIVTDKGTSKENQNQNACDDTRKEGEPKIVFEVDNTNIGEV